MARVRIDPFRTLGTIDRRIYGNFAEHLGRCIYGGMYEPDSPMADDDGFRTDVLQAVRDLQVSVLRWPGGNFVSGYHWLDGVGPREQRPPRPELAWGGIEPNSFGTDEYIRYCRKAGVEPYIAVNMGSGTMDEAANWVEYCNGTRSTHYANLRRQNGNPDPYNVKLWGLGNEVYGQWQIGYKNADDYATAATEFAKLMKWTDPSIELVLCGQQHGHNEGGTPDPGTEWNWKALKKAGKHANYLSLHSYWHPTGFTWAVREYPRPMTDDEYYSVVGQPYTTEENIQHTWGLIEAARAEYGIKHPIHIAFDEWNVWYRALGGQNLEEKYDLKDALTVAIFLQILQRNCQAVKIANLAQLVNVIAPIFATPEGMYLQSIYYPLLAGTRYSGSVSLDTWVESESFGSHKALRPTVPYLSAQATLAPEQKKLYVNLVNARRGAEEAVQFELADCAVRGGSLHLITGASPEAENSLATPNAVGMSDTAVAVSGSRFMVVLPPHSCGVLELDLA